MTALNQGDTAFVLICAALVFIMTPGLGFFYGGLGRRKNCVNNLMACYFILGLCMLMWVLFGYSLSFTGNNFGIIGGFDNALLLGIGINEPSPYSGSINSYAFVAFQMMFALITPAIITGAVAGRMKFSALFIFIAAWSIIVYYPLAHMVWGKGGLLGADGLKAVDFAGGNVVHISSGVSGLVLCLALGKRFGYATTSYRLHNLPFVALGAALLWFGWYGFNAGSALGANGLAAHAFLTTSFATACGLLSWLFMDVIRGRKPSLVSGCTGIVAGLVAITPAAGFVPIWASVIIGLTAGPICYLGIIFVKQKLKIDDALDAFGCHGIGGMWGGIMTGVFATPAVNPDACTDGLIYGSFQQFGSQIASILVTIVVAAVGTLICVGIVRIFTQLRVGKREELIGLDVSQHGENAYPSFNGLD
ncbi:MAG: ammonium transporter [Deltaproteobacteria bacterium]|jgi:Amt family ammonium transporter|nr:ammonium transporter [Deltaproteobacteria bacterium]